MTAQLEVLAPAAPALPDLPRRRPLLIGEFLVVLGLLRFYDLAREHAEVRRAAALDHGAAILSLERWLHLDVERTVNIWASSHRLLSLLASNIYEFAHVTVTLGVLIWCYLARPELYRRARNALVLVNVTGLVVFLWLPVAPPRLLPGTGFVDTVALAGFGPTHSGPVPADQYGAMPSLHIAWAVWSALIAGQLVRHLVLRPVLLAYPVLVAVIVVMTANHYLLDIAMGALVAVGSLAAAPERGRLLVADWARRARTAVELG